METESELEELDAWIANLMEPKPEAVPLRLLRRGNEHLYNSAPVSSKGGWWTTDLGSDYESGDKGADTLCVWRPSRRPCSDPDDTESKAAAMEALERCCKSVCVNVEIWFTFESWYVATPNRSHYSNAETLPLAICLFAKKLFVGIE